MDKLSAVIIINHAQERISDRFCGIDLQILPDSALLQLLPDLGCAAQEPVEAVQRNQGVRQSLD